MTTIHPFDHLAASQAEYEAFNQLSNVLRAERTPDLPPIPLAERIEHLQNVPSFMGYRVLTVPDENNQFIALTEIAIPQTEENRHLAQFMIQVLPAHRRKGYGRSLLRHVAQLAQENGRHLLISSSYGNVPAGAAFLERLGASRGLETHTNRLDLENLDRRLLNDWLDKGRSLSQEFELGLWVGRYPEEELDAIARLMDVMNQQPHDDLSLWPLRLVITYPTVVTIFKHMVTAVRPLVEALPRGKNRLGSFNVHLNARFDKVTYLPQLTDQGSPASRTSSKGPAVFPFLIQRIQFLERFNRKDVFFDGNMNVDAAFIER
jgi:GNAT superfamily N-acetyltransferase